MLLTAFVQGNGNGTNSSTWKAAEKYGPKDATQCMRHRSALRCPTKHAAQATAARCKKPCGHPGEPPDSHPVPPSLPRKGQGEQTHVGRGVGLEDGLGTLGQGGSRGHHVVHQHHPAPAKCLGKAGMIDAGGVLRPALTREMGLRGALLLPDEQFHHGYTHGAAHPIGQKTGLVVTTLAQAPGGKGHRHQHIGIFVQSGTHRLAAAHHPKR